VAKQGSEDLVTQISERVREALAEAEKRAEHIVAEAKRNAHEAVSEAEARARELVAEAEREAERIRTETEQEARERVERARAALDELGQALKPGNPTTPADPPPPAAEEEAPAPEEAPAEAMPEPVASEPEPEPEPEPASSGPSTEELINQLRGGGEESSGGQTPEGRSGGDDGERGDAGAARLVAMNMALEGASREDVDRRLAEEFQVDDRNALLDDVFSRVGK
jgi:vacuolar-type H+-ATPase subunit H